MAQRSTHVHNLFIVRWGHPKPGDRATIEGALLEVRARVGAPLVYVAVLPADTPPFGEEERRLLAELTRALLPHCARIITVIEARGFRAAMLRSAMTAVTLLTGRRDSLHIADSLDTALELASAELPPRPMVRQALRDVGCDFARAS